METILPSREELVSLRKNHTVAEIAKIFKKCKSVIEVWLKRYDIKYHECRFGAKPLQKLTELQEDIIAGTMLGDGSIPFTAGKNFSFQFTQSLKKEDYVVSLCNGMTPFSRKLEYISRVKPVFRKGKIVHPKKGPLGKYIRFRTATLPIFTEIRKRWYAGNIYSKGAKKIVPRNLKLNWRSVAFWFCDDGSYGGSIYIYTDSFSEAHVDLLIGKLKRHLGVSSARNLHQGKPIIHIKASSHDKFFSGIRPYLTFQSMQYKLPNL